MFGAVWSWWRAASFFLTIFVGTIVAIATMLVVVLGIAGLEHTGIYGTIAFYLFVFSIGPYFLISLVLAECIRTEETERVQIRHMLGALATLLLMVGVVAVGGYIAGRIGYFWFLPPAVSFIYIIRTSNVTQYPGARGGRFLTYWYKKEPPQNFWSQ